MTSYVIQNPDNNLLWNRRGQYWSSERGGDYTTYSTAPRAEAAIRRNEYLRHRGLIVKADPASQRPAGLP